MSNMVLRQPTSLQEAWSVTPSTSAVLAPPPTAGSSYTIISPSSPSLSGNRSWGLDRPKSTPANLRSRQNASVYHYHELRPRTALGNTSDCDRVHQVSQEPTRKHNLDSHLPVRKSRPPPWQKTLDGTCSPCVVAPGYILSRSKSKILMQIKTDEFFNPESAERSPEKNPERDALIVQLQQQIDDLSLYLEEERLNHKETKRKAAEGLSGKTEQLHHQHKDQLRQQEEKYETEIDQMKISHNNTVRDLQAGSENAMAKLRGELEFLQGAFESYRSQVQQEVDDKWKKKEHDAKIQHQEELQHKAHEIRARMLTERNSEKADLERRQQREIQKLRLDNKKEVETLLQRFSNQGVDLERLKEAEAKLETATSELNTLKKDHESTCRQLIEATRDLADTKVRLVEFEHNFHGKVQEVDDKYHRQIHDLMEENTALRRLYVKKCGELFDEKQLTEQVRTEQVANAKDTMKCLIQSRTNAEISIVAPDVTLDENKEKGKERPISAPATKIEEKEIQLSAGDPQPNSHLTRPSSVWKLDGGDLEGTDNITSVKTQEELGEFFIRGTQMSGQK